MVDTLTPEVEEQDPLLAPPIDEAFTKETPVFPINAEEQAFVLARAKDGGADLTTEVQANSAAIREGRIASLREPIISQEFTSYIGAMKDIASLNAARGQQAATVQAMSRALEMEDYVAKTKRLTPTTENIIVANTALSNITRQEAKKKEVLLRQVDSSIEEYGELHGLRNSILALREKQGDTPILDGAAYVGNNFLPFVWALYEKKFFDVARKATGKEIPYSSNPLGWIEAIHDRWIELDDDGKESMLRMIDKDTFGILGDNKMAKKTFLEILATYTSGDIRFHDKLVALGGAADVFFGLGALMSNTVRAGQLAKAMAETAGKRAVGRSLADTLVTDQNAVLGVNNAEAMSKAIAAGKHPYSIDPAVFEGAAPHMQERLKEHWDKMVDAERQRLKSDGIPQAERMAQLDKMKASYSTAHRKDIYAVKFAGAPDGDALKLTMTMTDEEGNLFRTEESARAYAHRRGLPDDAWKLTTPEAEAVLDTGAARANMRAFHGGDQFDAFRSEFIGRGQGGTALGHGFSVALTRNMAEWFAKGRFFEGKTPTIYELSLPDQKWFLDFSKGFTKQSDEVKAALANVLTPDELVVLKNKDGRSIYDILTKRLGSTERASNALEKSGIVGNTEKLLKDREFLVFNEDVMNRALKGKEGVAISETKAGRDARRAAEYAEDAEARGVMDSFAQSDPVRAALGAQKSFLAMTPEGVQRLSVHRAFDNPTVGLFGREQSPLQFSGAFNSDTATYYTNMTKLLGMENERALFVTHEDVGQLMRRPELQLPRLQDRLREFNAVVTRQSGAYIPLQLEDGRYFHLIGIGKHADTTSEIRTGLHEMGHMFDNVYLRTLHSGARKALLADFSVWVKSKYGRRFGVNEMAERIFSPDLKAFNTYETLRAVAEGSTELKEAARAFTAKEWLSSFEEYVAEQMTKWGTTDARAINEGEKVWASWRDQIRAFYQKAVAQMNRFFGREVMTNTPEQAFKDLMNTHLTRVNELREEGLMGGNVALPSLDFTRSNIRGQQGAFPSGGGTPSIRGPMGPAPKPASGYLVKVTMDDPIKADGTYDPSDIASMPWFAADPRHGVSVDAMMGRVVGVHQTSKTRRDMSEMLKKPLSALNKSERERVLLVLEEGDQASHAGGYGREFTAPELLAKGLGDAEIEAYFTVRQTRMLNYFIHNKEMVESMRRKGLMEVEVFGQGKMAGTPLSIEAAQAVGKKTVYDATLKEFVELSANTAYAEGKRLIRLAKEGKVDGHDVTLFLASEKEATARTVHTALHYRPGEFARIYSDNYFIRMTTPRVVDGVNKLVDIPVRSAASEKEASEFIGAVTKGRQLVLDGASDIELEKTISKFYGTDDFREQVVSGQLKDMAGMRFHFTREVDDYLGQTLESHAGTGKLFTRDRGEQLLTADRTRAARSNILNPYESLSREITMVSHFASVNSWKEAQIDRWMNSFGDMLGSNRTGDNVRDFFAAAGGRFSHITGKKGQFAERTHAYIMRQVGIQTQEHVWWQSLMRRVGEGVMPYVGEGVGAVIRDANPLNFLRSVNHHFTLGLFNFSQLLVQANGMSVAAAIHPIYGLKAASMFPAVRLALMSDNPEVWARISKVAGEDVGRLAQAIRRSGLIDNLRSTSLHNIEDGKLDVFASMPKRGLSTAIDKGAFFFNRGEEFARVVSFDIARREWEKLNPGKDFLSKGGMEWIVSKSDDYTMNMTRANLARWQEGVMSIPTQFLQYNIKLLQNIASGLVSGGGKGRGFTRSEALKALAGSIAFYGAAGMGVSNMMGEWIPDEVQEKMPSEVKAAIGQGVLAAGLKALVESTTGERFDIALGQRLGSINFFTDLVYNAYYDPKNVWEMALGPSKATGERIAVFADIVNLWRKQPEVTLDDVGRGALQFFTEQVSATRNATKAYYVMQGNNVLKNRKGEPIAELSNPEIWAQAVGLAPTAAYDAYQLIGSRRAHYQALEEIATMVFQTQKRILEARQRQDEDAALRMEAALQLMFPVNYGDHMHVKRLVREKIAPYDTQFQKMLIDHAMSGANFNKPFAVTTPDVKR